MIARLLCLLAASAAYGQASPPGANPPAPAKQNVVERVSAATVFVKTDTGSGTGFIVSGDGTIVTANHVIADAKKVACKTGSGEIFDKVSLLARDERRDIAILKVAGFELPKVEFADLNRVEPSQHVFVIGNPLDLGNKDSKMTVTDGIVSGLRDFGWGYKVLQISAPITPGNSGGPVVNDEGKVLGVASFKAVAGESLSFATPIDYVRGLLAAAGDGKPLASWNSPVSDSPFDTEGELTDYWKTTGGETFYLKDNGTGVTILNVTNPESTYDFKWSKDLVIGIEYRVVYVGYSPYPQRTREFCVLKKIDPNRLHRVCFGYRKEYDDARIIAEGEKRFQKPKDIWIRVH